MLKYYIVEVLLWQWLNVPIFFISLWICNATHLAAKYLLCPVIIICSSNANNETIVSAVLLLILHFFGSQVGENEQAIYTSYGTSPVPSNKIMKYQQK